MVAELTFLLVGNISETDDHTREDKHISQCLLGYSNFLMSNLLQNILPLLIKVDCPFTKHVATSLTWCWYSRLTLQGGHVNPIPSSYAGSVSWFHLERTWVMKKRRNAVLPFCFWGHLDNSGEEKAMWREKWLQSGSEKQWGPSFSGYHQSKMEGLNVFSFLIISPSCWYYNIIR